MIDIHCHILPEIDDGADDVAVSIAMAQQAIDDGIHTIVATPHTLNGVYTNSLSETVNQVVRLRRIFSKNQLNLNLHAGAEVHLCVRMKERILSEEAAILNDKRGTGAISSLPKRGYVLVEFPVQAIPHRYKEELFQLKVSGITPIIGHPERNAIFRRELEILYELVAMGCLLQLTASSITGGFGRDIMQFSHRLLELRLAHVIASDAHSDQHRPPILSPAVEAAAKVIKSRDAAEAMVTTIPEAILAGKPVDLPEPGEPRKKNWFMRLWEG